MRARRRRVSASRRLFRSLLLAGLLSTIPLAALALQDQSATHAHAAREPIVGPRVLDLQSRAGWIYASYWTRMRLRDSAGGQACAEAATADCALAEWRAFVGGLAAEDRLAKLDKVNRYINRVAYRDDQVNWGQRDYWATPREFFGRGGDCEDYAIAKYQSLKALGLPVEELRLLILWDSKRGIAHAVLAVGPPGRELVLDNVHSVIYPLSALPHYRVHYSLNDEMVMSHLPQSPAAGALAAGP